MLSFRTAAFALILGLNCAYGATVSINFEALPGLDGLLGTPDDTLVTPCSNYCFDPREEYASTGIHFTTGELYYRSGNHFLSSVPLNASFSVPVFDVGIKVVSSYWTVKLTAYDAANQVLASQTLVNSSPGSQEIAGNIILSAVAPIKKIFVAEAGCVPGGPCGPIVVLDNLQFTVSESVSAIPEPSTQLAGVLGIIFTLIGARKRGKSAVRT